MFTAAIVVIVPADALTDVAFVDAAEINLKGKVDVGPPDLDVTLVNLSIAFHIPHKRLLSGSAPISSRALSPEVGALFQIKNKLILGAGVQYDNITNNVNATFTLGVKIW